MQFVISLGAMFDLVSKCRSAVRAIQKYNQLKFVLQVVTPVNLLLSTWIHWRVPFPKEAGYYFATSDSSTVQGYAEALGIEQVLQTLLYTSFSVILFFLFRMALSNLLSFFAVVMFMTNAQVILVYLSAPFWDFSTAIIPLAAITGTISLLLPQHKNLSLTRKIRRKFVLTIACLSLVIVSLYLRIINLYAQQRISIFASAIVLLITTLFWLNSEKDKTNFDYETSLRARGNDRLFFIPILFTLFLLQPILGRGGKSYATMILVVCMFVFVLSENRLRTSYKFAVPTIFLLLVYFRSREDYFQFYGFKGWTNAHQLIVGRDEGLLTYGVTHTDWMNWQVMEANTRHGLRSFLQNVSINAPSVVENIKIGFDYLVHGFWKFHEPPLGFENSALFQGRGYVVLSIGVVAPILFFVAIIIFIQRASKIAIVSAFIGLMLILTVGLTLTMMHQWWALQIVGLYGSLYAISWLRKTIVSTVFSQDFSIRSRNKVIHCKQTICRIISKKSVVQFLFLLFIFVMCPKIVFSVLNYAAEKLKTNRLEALVTEYSRQDWAPISINNGDTENIALQRDSNLIKVEVSTECSLTGVRIAYSNSDAEDTLGLEKGEFYRTKFHIANTTSKIVYIPFFPRNISKPAISVFGAKVNCSLRVYQASLKEQILTLAALLVPDKETRKLKFLAEGSGISNSSGEVLLHPLSFEGYVKNRGYQAVGDELSHQWLNDQIADRILGRSKQGYQAVDIWRQKIELETDTARVLFRGSTKRGILVIGWAIFDPAARSVVPVQFNYAVHGSTFDSTTRSLFECFELPPSEKMKNGSKVEFFVGSVFDLYSPRWTNYEINSIIFDQGSCDSNMQSKNFLPTL